MTTKTKAVIIATALLTSYAFGRFSAPEKIKIETKTVEEEKKTDQTQTDADRNRRRETTKTEVTRPDGTTEKTEKTVETSETHKETDRKDTSDTSTTSETSKEVTRGSSKVTIGALGAFRLTSPTVSYGVWVSRPILGPITLGVFGLTDSTVGGMIGLTF